MMRHHHSMFHRHVGQNQQRSNRAFTLFEVILALALSTILLMLIGTAIHLFLRRIEARRSDVEMSQLARAIFTMIGDDLRAASEYRPQDLTGAIAVATAAVPDVGEVVDGEAAPESGGSGQLTGGSQTTPTPAAGAATATSATSTTTATSTTIPPGIQGTLLELSVDSSRPPRLDHLFQRYAGYTAITTIAPASQTGPGGAPMSGAITPATDLRTVRYFVRQGQAIDTSTADATSLSPSMQYLGNGLVRQEISRAEKVYAEQIGDSSIYEMGQQLIAPEVGRIEFRYFDGSAVLGTWDTALQSWDMTVNAFLPPAIEVRIYLGDPDQMASAEVSRMAPTALAEIAREFRQVIYLPTAKPLATTTTETTATTTTQ